MTGEELNKVVIHCKGLLFDEDGRLLLVRQAENLGTYWNAPGGRMEEDDSPEGCMRREVREETGLTVESAILVYSHAIAVPGVIDVYFGFHVTKYSGQEILDIRFVDRNEEVVDPIFPAKLWDVAAACLDGGVSSIRYLGTETLDDYRTP